MPNALSPSARVRTRTSDISDFLRGRHDPKASSDSQRTLPPPVPRPGLSPAHEPVTPPKPKSKFAFLGRKRLASFSPSSAKTDPAAAAAVGRRAHETNLKDVPPLPASLSDPGAAVGRAGG